MSRRGIVMAINTATCDTAIQIGLIGRDDDFVPQDDWEVLIRNIEKLMAAKGMTRAELAKKLEIDSSTISYKLSGKREITYKEASKIAKALGVSLSALSSPDLIPDGAELFSDPQKALEALARHLGRETRPKRDRSKKPKPD